ncbi:hypothetical protein BAZSYMB_SCAFFOLD00004_27 [Bathymodiolus azoricus thioautotrophic gill symbiont]|uniref:Uncharacterized protein n=1 Tax=Bathymodiolus azoricus thioautotrophic gill symbiont TaxID=235205 RepID=A0A1H6J5W1_9GAMM|nr:hypothetical protein BAZSYMB_SCAFFOLD00004_27 [Bathymodiolus azoricus thioautotrophic gill symbiont]
MAIKLDIGMAIKFAIGDKAEVTEKNQILSGNEEKLMSSCI